MKRLVLLVALVTLLAGCATYYESGQLKSKADVEAALALARVGADLAADAVQVWEQYSTWRQSMDEAAYEKELARRQARLQQALGMVNNLQTLLDRFAAKPASGATTGAG